MTETHTGGTPNTRRTKRLFIGLPGCWFAGAHLPAFVGPFSFAELPVLALFAPPVLLASVASAAAFHPKLGSLFSVTLLASAFSLGVAQTTTSQGEETRCSAPTEFTHRPSLYRFLGHVVRVRHREQDTEAQIRVLRSSFASERWPYPGCSVIIRNADANPGDVVSVVTALTPVHHARNLSPAFQPIQVKPAARSRLSNPAQLWVLKNSFLATHLNRIRAHVRSSFTQSLSPRSAAVARALVLGDGGAVQQTDRQVVQRAGISHLLAVSGLHIAILAGSFRFLLFHLLLCIPAIRSSADVRRLAAGCAVPAVFFFAAFAGGSPSAWRAACMAGLHWSVQAIGRRPDTHAVTALAATLLGIMAPGDITRPGFLLSVLATAALVAAPITRRSATGEPAPTWIVFVRRFVLDGARLSARACVATGPVLYGWFGSVPAVSLAANLLMIPIASWLWIPLAFIHGVSASIGIPVLTQLSAATFEITTTTILELCAHFAWIDLGTQLPPPTATQVLASGMAAFSLTMGPWRRTRVWLLLTVCLWCASEAGLRASETSPGTLRVTFVDVGQGDAALLDLPDGQLVLVDAGGWITGFNHRRRSQSSPTAKRPNTGRRILLPLLAARRRQRVDLAVLSHGHPDHYGGMEELFSAMRPTEFWATRQRSFESPGGPAARLPSSLKARGTRVLSPDQLCDAPRMLGDVRVSVLAPCPRYDPGYGDNDNSLVVMFQYGRTRILFTGDIEHHGEEALLAAHGNALQADILKVPHHGSKTSSSPALLEAVSPTIAIASAGRNNRFGHPHPAVLERHADRRIALRRTDLEGSIQIKTDGNKLWLRSHLHPAWTAVHQSR